MRCSAFECPFAPCDCPHPSCTNPTPDQDRQGRHLDVLAYKEGVKTFVTNWARTWKGMADDPILRLVQRFRLRVIVRSS